MMRAFRERTAGERVWEIIPGAMFWTTLILCVVFSYLHPAWVAVFIILFDLYWLLKAVNSAIHIMSGYLKYRFYLTIDWLDWLGRLRDLKAYKEFLLQLAPTEKKSLVRGYLEVEAGKIESAAARAAAKGKKGADFMDVYHVVLYPFVNEGYEVLSTSLASLSQVHYPVKERMIVLLASEERAGESAQEVAKRVKDEFGDRFHSFFVSVHPDGLPGEIKGKSANASWAMKSVLPELERLGISTDSVIVSNFDSDTIVHPEYFSRVTYEFLIAEEPYRCSYQPIAIYNNNIWDSPALIRLVSINNTFWQFLESSRPNRLRTFSSHSMTLRALVDVGFWRKDLINEDGYIFWQCYLHYGGNYRSVPIFISISLDTCYDGTFWQTMFNQYKQKRRWAYNVEYYPTLLPALLKLKISLGEKIYKIFQFVEGNYNWATASIVISILGWLPLIVGGGNFGQTVIATNLPVMTRTLMTIATAFLIFSVYINMVILPPRPAKYTAWRSVEMYLQWFLVPLISVLFGSLPAVDAQTRLMFGKYMQFWVTPKYRSGEEVLPHIHDADAKA